MSKAILDPQTTSPSLEQSEQRALKGSGLAEMRVLPEWLDEKSQTTAYESPDSDGQTASATGEFRAKGNVTELVRLPPPADWSPRRFKVMQQWEGVVTEISGDSVWAQTEDLTCPDFPTEIVELPAEEFGRDCHLLAPGAVFYWIVGYETTPGGTVRRVSEIRMKRRPRWSKVGVESAADAGRRRFLRMTRDEGTSTGAE